MGLLSKLKGLLGKQPPVVLSTSQITAGTTDYIVKRNFESIEPAIKRGFESLGIRLIDEFRASEARTIKQIIDYFENKIQTKERVSREDVLAEFDKAEVQKIHDLKKALKASSAGLNYHLNNLINEGLIERADYGTYRKKIQSINKEMPKEDGNRAEEGLKHLFGNDEST